MFALIRFRYILSRRSEAFFPLIPPPPSFISTPKTLSEVIKAQGFNVGFYGSSELGMFNS